MDEFSTFRKQILERVQQISDHFVKLLQSAVLTQKRALIRTQPRWHLVSGIPLPEPCSCHLKNGQAHFLHSVQGAVFNKFDHRLLTVCLSNPKTFPTLDFPGCFPC